MRGLCGGFFRGKRGVVCGLFVAREGLCVGFRGLLLKAKRPGLDRLPHQIGHRVCQTSTGCRQEVAQTNLTRHLTVPNPLFSCTIRCSPATDSPHGHAVVPSPCPPSRPRYHRRNNHPAMTTPPAAYGRWIESSYRWYSYIWDHGDSTVDTRGSHWKCDYCQFLHAGLLLSLMRSGPITYTTPGNGYMNLFHHHEEAKGHLIKDHGLSPPLGPELSSYPRQWVFQHGERLRSPWGSAWKCKYCE